MTPRDLITFARSNPAYVAREALGMLLCFDRAFPDEVDADCDHKVDCISNDTALDRIARYIAANEDAPVDPLIEEIREQLGPKFQHLTECVAREYRADIAKAKGEQA